jgi:hypothetical protein
VIIRCPLCDQPFRADAKRIRPHASAYCPNCMKSFSLNDFAGLCGFSAACCEAKHLASTTGTIEELLSHLDTLGVELNRSVAPR